jgi:hypothetical protein
MASKDIAKFYFWDGQSNVVALNRKLGPLRATADALIFTITTDWWRRVRLGTILAVDVKKYLCCQESRNSSTIELRLQSITVEIG